MNIANKAFTFLSFRFFGRERTRKLILKLCRLFSIDPVDLGHRSIGIGLFGEYSKKSEEFLIHDTLPLYLNKKESLIFFDVGANIGNYTDLLLQKFESAQIHGFEPNPEAFKKYKDRFSENKNIRANNLALSSSDGSVKLFRNSTDPFSEQASVLENVMHEIYGNQQFTEIEIPCITIDSYCRDQGIVRIDFLKIDAEGFELEILKGASKMIQNNMIRIIQFEFNEMNVCSRVYLKDFYSQLRGYKFFRMLDKGLLELGSYNSRNEIFRYQNLVAINHMLLNKVSNER